MYDKFKMILSHSKQYKFEGSVLTLTDYYSGETVSIDLMNIDEDTFDELVIPEDEFEDNYFGE